MDYSIAFTGDIAFSQYFSHCSGQKIADEVLVDWLKDSDVVVGNIEAPVTDRPPTIGRKLVHTNPKWAVDELRELNISVWNLANNHIMDCGEEGITDTVHSAEKESVSVIGLAESSQSADYRIIGEKIKVGIVSLTDTWQHVLATNDRVGTTSWLSLEQISHTINELRQKSVDWIVVCIHAGDEFASIPMPSVRKHFLDILNLGADIIIGHHPHTVQNYEKVGNKIIFYSLGNFIFDTEFQRRHEHTDKGVLVRIHFDKKTYHWESTGIKINRQTGIVEHSSEPEVFINIDEGSYKKIWPFAARNLLINERLTKIYYYPDHADWPKVRWIAWEAKRGLQSSRFRELLFGKLLSVIASDSKTPALIAYLKCNSSG